MACNPLLTDIVHDWILNDTCLTHNNDSVPVKNIELGHLLLNGSTLIPAWIRNYIHEVWDQITYQLKNFNGCTVEVWEWISDFIAHFAKHLILICKSTSCTVNAVLCFHNCQGWLGYFWVPRNIQGDLTPLCFFSGFTRGDKLSINTHMHHLSYTIGTVNNTYNPWDLFY